MKTSKIGSLFSLLLQELCIVENQTLYKWHYCDFIDPLGVLNINLKYTEYIILYYTPPKIGLHYPNFQDIYRYRQLHQNLQNWIPIFFFTARAMHSAKADPLHMTLLWVVRTLGCPEHKSKVCPPKIRVILPRFLRYLQVPLATWKPIKLGIFVSLYHR